MTDTRPGARPRGRRRGRRPAAPGRAPRRPAGVPRDAAAAPDRRRCATAASSTARSDGCAAPSRSAPPRSACSPPARRSWCRARSAAPRAASSALLLVAAAALAGPLLVTWLLDRHRLALGPGPAPGRAARAGQQPRLLPPARHGRRPARRDARGRHRAVERRQRRLDRRHRAAAGRAARRPGRHGPGRRGPRRGRVAAVAAAAGVEHAYPLAGVTAQVRTDDEDVPGLAALSWESMPLRVLPAGGAGSAVDPGVVVGLAGGPRRAGHGRGEHGRPVRDRPRPRRRRSTSGCPATATTTLRIVAVYDRGLGFGGYLVGAPTLADEGVTAATDTVLVQSGDPGGARTELGALGPRRDHRRRRTPTRRPPRTPGSSGSRWCCCSRCSPSSRSAPPTRW